MTVRQLSLFSADLIQPDPRQLEGLLAGPGQVTRLGGTARVSVVVGDEWRVAALLAAFTDRGLTGERTSTVDGRLGVRTAYSAALSPLASGWLRGAVKVPPARFILDGQRLRLWVIAAGHPDGLGYLLMLGGSDATSAEPVGAALAGAGLAGVLLGPRSGGPAYRVTGRRRLLRLAELVGDPPAEVPPEAWPAAPTRSARS